MAPPRAVAIRYMISTWPVNVLVAATLRSLPARTRNVCSARRASVLDFSLVMPTVMAPCSRARSRTRLVSVDSPDWEMATTRASR